MGLFTKTTPEEKLIHYVSELEKELALVIRLQDKANLMVNANKDSLRYHTHNVMDTIKSITKLANKNPIIPFADPTFTFLNKEYKLSSIIGLAQQKIKTSEGLLRVVGVKL